jgi:hypothetical protein
MKDKCKYGTKVLIFEQDYGNMEMYIAIISKLLYCMKETNKLHNENNECFRITFRPSRDDESSRHSSFTYEMRWGFKEND